MNLIAIDPQINQCGVAYFNGKIVVTKIVDTQNLLEACPFAEVFGYTTDLTIIEKPYIKVIKKKNGQVTVNQGIDNLLITVGKIVQRLEISGNKVELIPAWGSNGWIQQMFGRQGTWVDRNMAISGMKNHIKSIYPNLIDVSQDEKAAACLGWWWLRTRGKL